MGDTTKRLPVPPVARDGMPSAEPKELQIRIPCHGRTAAQVLEDVAHGLDAALGQERNPLLILEDLGRLQDSVTTLIKGLSRLVYKYPRPVACWEFSGYAEAFLSVIDAAEAAAPPPPPPDPL